MEYFESDQNSHFIYFKMKINEHIRFCVQKNNNKDDAAEDKIPCEFCNKLFDFDSIFVHQVS